MKLKNTFGATDALLKSIEDIHEASKLVKPIPDHPYHSKSDESLRYIVKDASEAAKSMRGMDDKAESKYLDQVNDASTVLGYRKKGGRQDVKEDVVSESDKTYPFGANQLGPLIIQLRSLLNILSKSSLIKRAMREDVELAESIEKIEKLLEKK